MNGMSYSKSIIRSVALSPNSPFTSSVSVICTNNPIWASAASDTKQLGIILFTCEDLKHTLPVQREDQAPHIQESCQLCYLYLQPKCVRRYVLKWLFYISPLQLYFYHCLQSIALFKVLPTYQQHSASAKSLLEMQHLRPTPIYWITPALEQDPQVVHRHFHIREAPDYCLVEPG